MDNFTSHHQNDVPEQSNETNIPIGSDGYHGESIRRRGAIEYYHEPHRYNDHYDMPANMEEIQVTLEEPWSEQNEELLRIWKMEAEGHAQEHQCAGYRVKFKYRLLNFIYLLWSAVILVVNGILGCENEFESKVIALVVNSIGVFISGLSASLNLGCMYRVHFEYETKYQEVAIDITQVLAQAKSFRVPADQFITEIRERKKTLSAAPELPNSRFFFC